jgi:hypothetical protein
MGCTGIAVVLGGSLAYARVRLPCLCCSPYTHSHTHTHTHTGAHAGVGGGPCQENSGEGGTKGGGDGTHTHSEYCRRHLRSKYFRRQLYVCVCVKLCTCMTLEKAKQATVEMVCTCVANTAVDDTKYSDAFDTTHRCDVTCDAAATTLTTIFPE